MIGRRPLSNRHTGKASVGLRESILGLLLAGVAALPAVACGDDSPVRGAGRPDVQARAAEEAADETVGRAAVEVEGRAHLLEPALPQQRHPAPQRHRLALVVGDVDRGGAELLLEALQLGPRLHAQLRVEVRERLVHQVDGRAAHDGTGERDALALPARELGRPPLEQRSQLEAVRRLAHAPVEAGGVHPPRPQRKRHVLVDAQVRVERVALEHHRHVALGRGHVVHHALADQDPARVRALEPGQHAQQRRLAAARGPEQHQELAGFDLEVDLAQRRVGAEGLGDALEAHFHVRVSLSGRRLYTPAPSP